MDAKTSEIKPTLLQRIIFNRVGQGSTITLGITLNFVVLGSDISSNK